MAATQNKARVLVVEDDIPVAHLLRDLLRLEGFEADCVHEGQTAIDAVEAKRPDAIVLDIMLPDMSGFDVCQTLKLRRETNLIPIVMLTALNDDASVQSGYRVGANRYLVKPFKAEILIEALRATIGHARELRDRRTHTAVELVMASDTHAREQLNDLLSELFVQTPLSEEAIHAIRYAALEMIENAAEWGNRRQKGKPVTIRYEVTDKLVRFIITDQGPGFDPAKLQHAAKKDDPVAHMEIRDKLGLRQGGFGILISKGMVDEFKYNETGNQVTLTKYFQEQGTEAQRH